MIAAIASVDSQLAAVDPADVGTLQLDGHWRPLEIMSQVNALRRYLTFDQYFKRHDIGTDLSSSAASIKHVDFESKGPNGFDFQFGRTYSSLSAVTMGAEHQIAQARVAWLTAALQDLPAITKLTADAIFDGYFPLIRWVYVNYRDNGRAEKDQSFTSWDINAEYGRHDLLHLITTMQQIRWPNVASDYNGNPRFKLGEDAKGGLIWPYHLDYSWAGSGDAPEPVNYDWAELVLVRKLSALSTLVADLLTGWYLALSQQLSEAQAEFDSSAVHRSLIGDGWTFNIPFIRPPSGGAIPADGLVFFDGFRKASFGHLTTRVFPPERATLRTLSDHDRRVLAARYGPDHLSPDQIKDMGPYGDLLWVIDYARRHQYFDYLGRLRFEFDNTGNNRITYEYVAPDSALLQRITDAYGNVYRFNYHYGSETTLFLRLLHLATPVQSLQVTAEDDLGNVFRQVVYRTRGTQLVDLGFASNSDAFAAQHTKLLVRVDELAPDQAFDEPVAPGNQHRTWYDYETAKVFSWRLTPDVPEASISASFVRSETGPLGGTLAFAYHEVPQRFDNPLAPNRSLLQYDKTYVWSTFTFMDHSQVRTVRRDGVLVNASMPATADTQDGVTYRKAVNATPTRIDTYWFRELPTPLGDRATVLARHTAHEANYTTVLGPSSFEVFADFLRLDLTQARARQILWQESEFDPYGNVLRTRTANGAPGPLNQIVSREFGYWSGDDAAHLRGQPGFIIDGTEDTIYSGRGFSYDPVYPNLVSLTFGDVRSLAYVYGPGADDPAGSLNPTVVTEVGDKGRRIDTHLAYDDRGRLTRSQDAEGHVATYAYFDRTDDQGKRIHDVLVRRYDAAGSGPLAEELFVYDATGRLVMTIDGRRATTTHAFDCFDRITDVRYADGGELLVLYGDTPQSGLASYESEVLFKIARAPDRYDRVRLRSDVWGNLSQLVEFVEPIGQIVSTVEYDQLNRPIRVTRAQHATTVFEYDAWNRVTRTIDPRGGIENAVFDDLMHLRQVGQEWRLTRTETRRDPDGHRTIRFFDPLERVEAICVEFNAGYDGHLESAWWIYDWDRRSRLHHAVGPDGLETEWNYDDFDRLVSRVQHNAGRYVTEQFSDYNDIHQVKTYVDRRGATTTFSYDKLGRLGTVTRPLGDEVRLFYDEAHNIAVQRHNGRDTTYVYDERRRLTSVTDPLGNVTSHTYDLRGRLLTTADALGQTSTWSYDARGLVVEYVDPRGEHYQYAYNEYDGLKFSRNPLGPAADRSYRTNFAGDVIEARDQRGRVWSLARDSHGRLTELALPGFGAIAQYEYNTWGLLARRRVLGGYEVRYAYDADRRLVGTRDGDEAPVEITYDAFSNVRARSRGGDLEAWHYDYDPNGNCIAVLNGDELVLRLGYDDLNRLSWVEPRGNPTYLKYCQSHGGAWARATIAYDDVAGLTTITDQTGARTVTQYDDAGRMKKIVDDHGDATWFVRDGLGRIMRGLVAPDGAIPDPSDRTTWPADARDYAVLELTYEPGGLIRSVSKDGTNWTSIAYDGKGLPREVIDEEGWRTTFVNDPILEAPVVRREPSGIVRTLQRDAIGRVVAHDLNGAPVRIEYRDAQRRVVTTSAVGSRTEVHYRTDGRVDEIKKSVPGCVYRYDYDFAGRLMRVQTPLGTVITYLRDSAGNYTGMLVNGSPRGNVAVYSPDRKLQSLVDDMGTRAFTYDIRGALARTDYPDRYSVVRTYRSDGVVSRVTYSDGVVKDLAYDYAKNLVRVDEGTEAVVLLRDALRRVVGEIVGGHARGASYLRNGVISQLTAESGSIVYVWTAGGVLDRIEARARFGKALALQHDYYSNGWLRRRFTRQGYEQRYIYDADGRVSQLIVPGSIFGATYDSNGNPTQLRQQGQTLSTRTFAYDLEDRLILADQLRFMYDAFGNLKGVADQRSGAFADRAHDASNRLRAIAVGTAVTELDYDARGNLKRIDDGSTAWLFTYDAEHRLRRVSVTGAGDEEFAYDGVGRLLQNDITPPTRRERLGHVGPYVVEWESGGTTALVVPEVNTGRPLARVDTNGPVIASTVLGSTQILHDAAGANRGSTPVAPYGASQLSTRALDPFAFKGYFATQGGRHWAFSRYYDSTHATFLNDDLAPGDLFDPWSMNRRRLFHGNPMRYTDIFGYQDEDESAPPVDEETSDDSAAATVDLGGLGQGEEPDSTALVLASAASYLPEIPSISTYVDGQPDAPVDESSSIDLSDIFFGSGTPRLDLDPDSVPTSLGMGANAEATGSAFAGPAVSLPGPTLHVSVLTTGVTIPNFPDERVVGALPFKEPSAIAPSFAGERPRALVDRAVGQSFRSFYPPVQLTVTPGATPRSAAAPILSQPRWSEGIPSEPSSPPGGESSTGSNSSGFNVPVWPRVVGGIGRIVDGIAEAFSGTGSPVNLYQGLGKEAALDAVGTNVYKGAYAVSRSWVEREALGGTIPLVTEGLWGSRIYAAAGGFLMKPLRLLEPLTTKVLDPASVAMREELPWYIIGRTVGAGAAWQVVRALSILASAPVLFLQVFLQTSDHVEPTPPYIEQTFDWSAPEVSRWSGDAGDR